MISCPNGRNDLPEREPAAERIVEDDSLSVIIPAFNEATRIESSLQTVVEHLQERFEKFEILVVDDGSTDDTAARVQRFGHDRVRCLVNEANSGKGFSVRRGMLEARGDFVLFSDADLSTPIDETEKLLTAIKTDFDIAIASRWCETHQDVQRSFLRRLQGRAFALLVQATIVRGFRDTQCGFKMFRRQAAREIFGRTRIDGWAFDVEVLYLARKLNLRVGELPVRWHQSDESKLRLATPVTMVWDIVCVYWNDLLGRYELSSRPAPSRPDSPPAPPPPAPRTGPQAPTDAAESTH